MRFQSVDAADRIFAVCGLNTISFGIVAGEATKAGLLGFAVERIDRADDEDFFMAGFKVFARVIPHPQPGLQVSTFEHPVQSFVWDDFTAKPGREYTYLFHPIKGKPKNLDRSSPPLSITVRTEPSVSSLAHDIFFNRGVASSQAYQRRFGSGPIDKLEPQKRDEALAWLSRDLDEAILRFINSCPAGDQLRGCFYEFRYPRVAAAVKAAIDRGVDVRIIVDAKINERTDKRGVFHESFPRVQNLKVIAATGIPVANVILRQARPSNIAHNKFMVRLAAGAEPTEVWTGSTNISLGGISGQTNVGHWIRDRRVARSFARYWDLLSTDPGATAADLAADKQAKNRAFTSAVEELSPVPTDLAQVPVGAIPVFSPRSDTTVLDSYARLLDSAHEQGCVTLAFGISSAFKDLLKDNTTQNALVFMLLEKKDAPRRNAAATFVRINASNNVYQAWGSFLRDPVYQWAKETNTQLLGLNQHVMYIHSKFMLIDPLAADPIVVSGSANFSAASTTGNDENMVIIRGDRRVADIYFSEFNRLFNHYYFRSVAEAVHDHHSPTPQTPSLFLSETADWQAKYTTGTFRAKRLKLYADMTGFSTL
ncbi:MAG: phospholipase D-like domain-containing protein [Pseudonocardiaceae bacterium]